MFSITLILMAMQFYTKYNVNILEIYGIKLFFLPPADLFLLDTAALPSFTFFGGWRLGWLRHCRWAECLKSNKIGLKNR